MRWSPVLAVVAIAVIASVTLIASALAPNAQRAVQSATIALITINLCLTLSILWRARSR